jgi:hypothetical protein
LFEIWRINSTQYRDASQSLKRLGYVLARQLPQRLGLSGSPLLYYMAINQDSPLRAVRVRSDTYLYPWFYHLEDVESFADWYRKLPVVKRQSLSRDAEAVTVGTLDPAMQTAPMRDFRENGVFPSPEQS